MDSVEDGRLVLALLHTSTWYALRYILRVCVPRSLKLKAKSKRKFQIHEDACGVQRRVSVAVFNRKLSKRTGEERWTLTKLRFIQFTCVVVHEAFNLVASRTHICLMPSSQLPRSVNDDVWTGESQVL